jgi:long-chain acyl-CoA synthetase
MTNVPSYSTHPWVKFYESGIPASITYPELTLGSVLSQTVAKFPGQTALLFFGKRITYAELDGLVNKFSHSLSGLGVKKGDRVALMLPNVPQMVIAYYGTLRMVPSPLPQILSTSNTNWRSNSRTAALKYL